MSRRAALLFVIVLSAGCGNTPPEKPPLGNETCNNKKDDNGDGKVDCADPKCFKSTLCVGSVEVCDNGKDDNSDGKSDCADPMCEGMSCGAGCTCETAIPSETACGDGADNDHDGKTDCQDSDCSCDGGAGGGSGGGGGGAAAGGGAGGGSAAGGGSGGGSAAGGGAGAGVGGGTAGGTGGGTAGGAGGGTAGGAGGGTAGGVGGGTAGGVGGGTAGGAGGGTAGGVGGGTAGGAGGGTAGGTGGGTAGGAGGGTAGGAGGGAPATELTCSDNIDNDLDNKTDCDDPDCVTRSCGMGCVCVLNAKKETACSDGADNDNDGKIDCVDPDCVGVGTEICNDGIDNNCDRGIDCGDPSCTGNGACTNLNDGLPCRLDSQCGGNKCYTEAATGTPNGMCSNATTCTVGSNAGCHGGVCVEGGTFDVCQMKCTGTGLSGTGKCRAGFACYDQDTNTSNNNSGCIVLCTNDSECQGAGTGYGCNPWSSVCQQKNKSLGKYGAGCTSNAQCESSYCDLSGPIGYCFGLCRGDTKVCATDGVCDYDPAFQDNVGYCMDACSTVNTSSQCLNPANLCRQRSTNRYCVCGQFFEYCDFNSDCCSGSCGGTFSNQCD